MNQTLLEKHFFHWSLKNPQLLDKIKKGFYTSNEYDVLSDLGLRFFNKYGATPSKDQYTDILKVKGLDKDITESKVDAIFDVDLGQYETDWIKEQTEAWVEWKTFDSSLFELMNMIKTTKVTTENVHDLVEKSKRILLDRNNLSFDFQSGLDIFNPAAHKQRILTGFSTGYSFIDQGLGGGWSPKTLHCFVGAPKAGKSWWLSNIFSNGIQNGYNCAYVSCEVEDTKLLKRIGSNLYRIPYSQYTDLSQDESYMKGKISDFKAAVLKPGFGDVKEFGASTATVLDIENYLKKMQEINKREYFLVCIDYINILSNWRNPNTENTYMKIKQISEDLRAMAQRNNWCIVTATQTNRSAMNSSDMQLQDIAESAGLLHTVDSLWGLIRDEMMTMNKEYYLKALLLREEGGMGTKQRFEVNYDYGLITQSKDAMIDTI